MVRLETAEEKRHGLRVSLSARFALLVAGMLAAFACYAWLLAADAARDLAQRYANQLATEEARFLSLYGAEALAADPERGAARVAGASLAHGQNVSGAVLDPTGKLLLRWGPHGADAYAKGVRAPVVHDGVTVAELRVLPPRVGLDAILQNGFAQVISLTAAVLALAVAATRALVRRVIAPLRRLTAFAEGVSEQRMAEKIDIQTGDELETLAKAFNAMIGRLDESLRRIQQLAYVDPVTGLPNQERLQRALEEMLQSLQGERRSGALILLSFDQLRRAMDAMGRAAGEELLSAVGQRLAATLSAADPVVRLLESGREKAVLARLSGPEFAILLPSLEQEMDLERLVQMLSAPFARPFEHKDGRVALGLVIGAVTLPRDGADADAALRNARMALVAARNANQPARFFTPALDRDAAERLTLEREMRQGIEANQFLAYFQPKVCLRTGRIKGAEALARWIRPDGATIGPARFIPLAEELGMIGPIAEAIMRDACWKAAAWRREGLRATVAVNVSAIQLNDERFPALVRRMLDESGLSGSALELEITESVAMSDPERAIRLVEPLRAQGVRFAIDDFGTGHSSLAALTRLPFDVLKIDQSFVRSLSNDRQALSIIETILALAASLDFEAVAEGVETEAEAEFLRRRGCPLAQGYHFGRPIPPLEFLAQMRAEAENRTLRSVDVA